MAKESFIQESRGGRWLRCSIVRGRIVREVVDVSLVPKAARPAAPAEPKTEED